MQKTPPNRASRLKRNQKRPQELTSSSSWAAPTASPSGPTTTMSSRSIHSNNSYTMIHIVQENKNENEPLILAITRNGQYKHPRMAHPKEVPHCKNDWMTSDFFKKTYNWRDQESSCEKLRKKLQS
jgi:hypothetical protein